MFLIKIKERYFYGFGKKGQILTAWSILGAKILRNDEISNTIIKKLLEKKGQIILRKIG